jgi:hypothetical protein
VLIPSPFFPLFDEETILTIESQIAEVYHYAQPQDEEFKSFLFKYNLMRNRLEEQQKEVEKVKANMERVQRQRSQRRR